MNNFAISKCNFENLKEIFLITNSSHLKIVNFVFYQNSKFGSIFSIYEKATLSIIATKFDGNEPIKNATYINVSHGSHLVIMECAFLNDKLSNLMMSFGNTMIINSHFENLGSASDLCLIYFYKVNLTFDYF